jgi:dCTP deaminase
VVLSRQTILKRIKDGSIVIDPFIEKNLGPTSYDLMLGYTFVELEPQFEVQKQPNFQKSVKALTLNESYPVRMTKISEDGLFILPPKAFVLGTTLECVAVPNNIAVYVEGRSSIGRYGLQVQNAGFVDPGFEGQITLELFNALDVPIALPPLRRICQLVFFEMDEATDKPYSGKYMHQREATASRVELDYEVTK